jgi:23S rRNA (uridine2552-2'-O)-methyltransferase
MAADPHGRQRVKTAAGRSVSSQRWLARQLNDPYVAAAKRGGYRSRAAFKLIEIDRAHQLLRAGDCIVDLGAAPGGWAQVAAARVGAARGAGKVVAIDLVPIEAIPGVIFQQLDFLAADAPQRLRDALDRPVDVVLSDMAPAASGQPDIDHLRILNLAELALEFAASVLKPGGAFLAKLLQGSGERDYLAALRARFALVKRAKPPSSRPESAEFFVVAKGFRG